MNPTEPYRILVIDDNPAIHDDFRKVLAPARGADDARLAEMEAALFGEDRSRLELPRFEVDSAFQGREGLLRVEQALREGRPYAMAFVDIRMPPGWDGIETIERIWVAYPELEVAICTAYSDYSWEDMIARLGRTDHLLTLKKPFDNVEVRQLASCLATKWALGRTVRHQLDDLQRVVQERTRTLEANNQRLQQEIAQHQRAKAAVNELGHRMELILNAAGEGICGVDAEGRATFVNPAAAQMLGRRAGDLIGQPLAAIIQPSLTGPAALALTCQTGTSHRATDEVFQRQDGTAFPVEYVTAPIREAEQVVGAVLTFRDVTQRKEAEAQLRRAKQLAEAATQAKSDFLANISHEMRTPMNAIFGFTEIALETADPATRRECLEGVRRTAGSLLAIINDILDIAKVEAGKLDLEIAAFSLQAMLDDVLRALSVRADEKHLELALQVSDDVPDAILGDASRLRQILLNLLGNALKFTDRGHVVLRVEREGGTTHQDAVLHFAVADTGIGIAPEMLGVIFQPFVQADGSMSRRYGGTGLGLSIATRLVELMGGRIWVESTLGEGSTFHFTARLRLAQDAATRGPLHDAP